MFIHSFIYLLIYLFIYLFTCVYVCKYVCIYVCMYVCMYVCILVCIYVHYMYVCISSLYLACSGFNSTYHMMLKAMSLFSFVVFLISAKRMFFISQKQTNKHILAHLTQKKCNFLYDIGGFWMYIQRS